MSKQFITAQKGHGPVMLGARYVRRNADATADDIERSLTRIQGEIESQVAYWTPARIAGLVDDALRPLRAEMALVEKKQKEAKGMRVNSQAQENWAGFSLNAHVKTDGGAS